MPLFNFYCETCKEHTRKLLPHLTEEKKCKKCGAVLARVSNPTTRVVEVLDNGAMPRKVEQLAGVDEMVKDRSDGQT